VHVYQQTKLLFVYLPTTVIARLCLFRFNFGSFQPVVSLSCVLGTVQILTKLIDFFHDVMGTVSCIL